jgi:D-3-phosphoglycerate dehydrogenase
MNILVTAPYTKEGLDELRKLFDTVVYDPWFRRMRGYSPDELLAEVRRHRAEGIIVELDEIDQSFVEKAKPVFIGITRATPSTIDLQAIRRRGIPLFEAPARNVQAVTELLIANVIASYRFLYKSSHWMKEGQWTDRFEPYVTFRGRELFGRKVGLLGLGAVGKNAAKLFEAFSCRIAYHDPYVEADYERLSPEKLFESCDIVSVHLPSVPETKGFVNSDLLNRLKEEALFVNTSRSSVVDTEALYHMLEQKRIFGAVLDVFDQEPPDESVLRLIRLPNVLCTPHIAGATSEVVSNHSRLINRQIREWKVLHDSKRT